MLTALVLLSLFIVVMLISRGSNGMDAIKNIKRLPTFIRISQKVINFVTFTEKINIIFLTRGNSSRVKVYDKNYSLHFKSGLWLESLPIFSCPFLICGKTFEGIKCDLLLSSEKQLAGQWPSSKRQQITSISWYYWKAFCWD